MRILYQRRKPVRNKRYLNVKGGNIFTLQRNLNKAGINKVELNNQELFLSIEGDYGPNTEAAILKFQQSKGLNATGAVNEETWKQVNNTDKIPSLFSRCLGLTAAYEGHDYTLAKGPFDKGVITYGVIGFTEASGSLKKVIERIKEKHPEMVREAFGEHKEEKLLWALRKGGNTAKQFAYEISQNAKRGILYPVWADAFKTLGNFKEVQKIQDDMAYELYWKKKALDDIANFGEYTEIDAALFFDTAVQNGGVDSSKEREIKRLLAKNGNPLGRHRLALIARAIANKSNPKYFKDVLSRKSCIATGEGNVHKGNYLVEDWGLTYTKVTPEELLRR